jgi:hypothetical protein
MFVRQEKVLFGKGLAEIHHAGGQPSATRAGCLSRGLFVGLTARPAAQGRYDRRIIHSSLYIRRKRLKV